MLLPDRLFNHTGPYASPGAFVDQPSYEIIELSLMPYISFQVILPSTSGAGIPLQLAAYWKCEKNETDFKLDYKYNGNAVPNRNALSNVTILVPMDGEVQNMEARPEGKWSSEHKRAMWRLGDVSEMSEEGSQGCLRAKVSQSSGH